MKKQFPGLWVIVYLHTTVINYITPETLCQQIFSSSQGLIMTLKQDILTLYDLSLSSGRYSIFCRKSPFAGAVSPARVLSREAMISSTWLGG